ncbi:hypothetical protein [Natronorubrum daqingense]|uniref:Flagellin n=1 Tax=Natronorubrum daqingense TaxID=588898 RepID=A0A1N6ZAC3_9EURY|nr:hypothetical protein [Natronorubrum daqingense]SIR23747.1 hypothetical protein SAMN05421809_0735 [Natronorubrum daqingense]
MDVNEFLEGSTLTGRQAALIFILFLLLIIAAGILLILFSDIFRAFA